MSKNIVGLLRRISFPPSASPWIGRAVRLCTSRDSFLPHTKDFSFPKRACSQFVGLDKAERTAQTSALQPGRLKASGRPGARREEVPWPGDTDSSRPRRAAGARPPRGQGGCRWSLPLTKRDDDCPNSLFSSCFGRLAVHPVAFRSSCRLTWRRRLKHSPQCFWEKGSALSSAQACQKGVLPLSPRLSVAGSFWPPPPFHSRVTASGCRGAGGSGADSSQSGMALRAAFRRGKIPEEREFSLPARATR